MNYSLSALLMTVLAGNLLISLILLCLRSRKIMLTAGYRLPLLFLLLVLSRFLIPVALPFAKNIYLPAGLSSAAFFLRYQLFSFGAIRISALSLLGFVWIVGTICCLLQHHKENDIIRKYIRLHARDESSRKLYADMMCRICGRRRNPFHILTLIYFEPPIQYGILRPCIILPAPLELQEEELFYLLQHEAAHYYHHDLLIKRIVRFVCAVYWWNPLCKCLKNKVDLLLEMRVDDLLIAGDAAAREAYCRTLYSIREKMIALKTAQMAEEGIAASMSESGRNDLLYRENMMYRERRKHSPLFFLLAAFAAAVYIGSYCFIFRLSP